LSDHFLLPAWRNRTNCRAITRELLDFLRNRPLYRIQIVSQWDSASQHTAFFRCIEFKWHNQSNCLTSLTVQGSSDLVPTIKTGNDYEPKVDEYPTLLTPSEFLPLSFSFFSTRHENQL